MNPNMCHTQICAHTPPPPSRRPWGIQAPLSWVCMPIHPHRERHGRPQPCAIPRPHHLLPPPRRWPCTPGCGCQGCPCGGHGRAGGGCWGTLGVGGGTGKAQQSPQCRGATSDRVTPALMAAADTPGFLPTYAFFILLFRLFPLFQKYHSNLLVPA